MIAEQPLFTAAEIAAALGQTRQAIHRAMRDTPAAGNRLVENNLADTWTLSALPAGIVGELRERQQRFAYSSLAEVLANPPGIWQPALPLARVGEDDLRKAGQLRQALARVLVLPDAVSVSERARIAAPDYRAAMGRPISHGHLRAVIARTMERDAGANNWQRMEIYLDADLKPRASATARPPRTNTGDREFPELAEEFATVRNPAAPTPTETASCWRCILACLSARLATGEDEAQLKCDLRAFVVRTAPFLAESPAAFKRNLNRKLRAVEAAGTLAAVMPRTGRPRKLPADRIPDYEENQRLLNGLAADRNGSVSQAYRELHLGTAPHGFRFTAAFREHFPFDPRSAKSQVPAIMRDAARQNYIGAELKKKGGNFARSKRPSYPQDWSEEHSNAVHSADDVTSDAYVYRWDEDGLYEFEGRRFEIGRPQLIPMICDRTDFPLGCNVALVKQPTSRHVFKLLTSAWLNPQIGLPHKGAKFERGVFAALKIKALFEWPAIDERFIHAGINLRLQQVRGPTGKSAIEQFGDRIHRQETHLSSYCGKDERVTAPAKLRRFIGDLKRIDQPRKAALNPAEMLPSLEDYENELKRWLGVIAREPQNGKRLRGLSPAEAWTQFASGRPHVILPESLRYMLTCERFTRTVDYKGIRLPFGKWDERTYSGGDRLGGLIRETVEVYLNPDFHEHVICIHRRSDPRGINPFSVPLTEEMKPNGGASKHDFDQAREHRRSFIAAASGGVIVTLMPPTSYTMRNERLASPDTHERGERFNALEAGQIAIEDRREQGRGKIKKLAGRHGLSIDPAKVRNPERVIESLSGCDDLEAQIRQMEAEENARHE